MRALVYSLFGVALLMGCNPLQRSTTLLRPPLEGREITQQQVTVRIKALRDFECAHYFDSRLVSRGMQPLQIFIDNQSDREYIFDGRNIALPLLGKRTVGAKLYRSVIARSVVWLFGIPLYWKLFLPLMLIDMVFCLQSNKQVHTDIGSLCMNPREKVVVPPHSRVHKVLFTEVEEYNQHLVLTLTEKEGGARLQFNF